LAFDLGSLIFDLALRCPKNLQRSKSEDQRPVF
jgi:hypothetical protein